MDFNERQINDLTKSVKEIAKIKDKAINLMSSVVTPEMEKHMSPEQRQFILDSKEIFNGGDGGSITDQMNGLQELIRRGENII